MKKNKGIILLLFSPSFICIGCTNNTVSTNSIKSVNVTINKKINDIKDPAQNVQYIDHGHGKRGVDY